MSSEQIEVRVGQTVQWFVSAKSETPFAALVIQVHAGGMVTLLSYDESGFGTRRQNVWHRTAIALVNSPQLGVRFGCWDFVFPEFEGPAPGANVSLDSAESEVSRSRKSLTKKNSEQLA